MGTPKSPILMGFSLINYPAIGVSPFMETPTYTAYANRRLIIIMVWLVQISQPSPPVAASMPVSLVASTSMMLLKATADDAICWFLQPHQLEHVWRHVNRGHHVLGDYKIKTHAAFFLNAHHVKAYYHHIIIMLSHRSTV